MSFLLMVCLALVCLPKSYPGPWMALSIEQSRLWCACYVAVVGLHAFWVSRRVTWALDRDPSRRDAVLNRYERGRRIHQIVLIGLYLFTLTALGWGSAVGGGHFAELLWLAPFFVAQLLGWVFYYDADRAAHLAVYRLLDEEAMSLTWLEARQVMTPPYGGRWAYVGFQARQKFAFVFVPVFLIIALKEVERLLPEASNQWPPLLMQALSAGVMGCVLIGWPLMIRVVLRLEPLPPGPVRDRLMAASGRLGFHCSNVLVWNTRSGMANAMIVGLVPWLRYVIFTDGLLEEFSEDEIEAVFGHEIGHIRHQHMPYYLGFLALSTGALGLLVDNVLRPDLARLGGELSSLLPEFVSQSLVHVFGPGSLDWVPLVLFLPAYLFTAFGFLSRNCERQADVFGCRAVSGDRPDGSLFCPSGIAIFIRALEKVALVNGISRDKPGFFQSWQHGSIAQRVEFLERASRNPEIEARFQRRLGVIKWGVVVVLAGAVVVMVWGSG